ncbi:MAG: hypothetical protein ACYC3P_11135 [Bellilinea sp.]
METTLSPTLTVDRLFANWPQTTAVFLRRRFACIGCLMAPFDTLEDVARNYEVDLGDLLLELSTTIEGKNYHGGTENAEKRSK